LSVTLKEIAKAAGVSTTTVSYVLNQKGSISEETRTRVLQTVRRLGYKRHGRTDGNLALVSAQPLQGPLIPAIYQAAAEFGFSIHRVQWKDYRLAPPPFGAHMRIAGVILYGGLWHRQFLEELAQRQPVVLLGSTLPTFKTDSVWVDNSGALYVATDALLAKGHRRIGFINGPATSVTSAEKRIGFERAVQQSGLQIEMEIVDAGYFDQASGRAAAALLLERFPRVTAVIAGEDGLALGLLEELKERGLSVPGDVSVVSFRDDPALAVAGGKVAAIPLPEKEIAREAISRLVHRINGSQRAGQRVLIQPHLIRPEGIVSPP